MGRAMKTGDKCSYLHGLGVADKGEIDLGGWRLSEVRDGEERMVNASRLAGW